MISGSSQLFLQNLWVKGYDWDQPLSNTETIQWQNTCDKSTEFSKSIPRHAPSHAFAACNYVRCVDKSTINSHLLVHALAEDRVAWTEPCSKPIPTQFKKYQSIIHCHAVLSMENITTHFFFGLSEPKLVQLPWYPTIVHPYSLLPMSDTN
ncbi:hypothetical protein RB195_021911 [Necator americanus]|uniref:Uncharacterized protein n=1 Tax=Necator americanus TaxID=51031 RepID=A0ABR1EDE6_NECAM